MRFRLGVLAISALLVACGGNKSSDGSASEAGEIHEPPFTVTAMVLGRNGDKVPLDTKIDETRSINYSRAEYTFELYPDGRYKGAIITGYCNPRSGYRWWTNDPEEVEGRWTLTQREIGTNYQNVYELHLPHGSVFIPDDWECIYLDSWDACANLRTQSNNAADVTEVTRKMDRLQKIHDEYYDPEASDEIDAPDPWAKTFICVEDDLVYVMEFDDDDQVTIGVKGDPNDDTWKSREIHTYKYTGNQVHLNHEKGFHATVSSDGASIRTRNDFGEKRIYTIKDVNELEDSYFDY